LVPAVGRVVTGLILFLRVFYLSVAVAVVAAKMAFARVWQAVLAVGLVETRGLVVARAQPTREGPAVLVLLLGFRVAAVAVVQTRPAVMPPRRLPALAVPVLRLT
jgi:hypothetical protein